MKVPECVAAAAFTAAVTVVSGSAVRADTPAVRVTRAELGGLAWLVVGDCRDASSDLVRRQCEGVRAHRMRALGDRILVVRADAGALGRDGTVYGCLACTAPLDGRYVTTDGPIAVDENGVRGPILGHLDAPESRARIDLQVRLRGGAWSQAGRRGVALELAGWRAYDFCTGRSMGASVGASAEVAAAVPLELGGTDCAASAPESASAPTTEWRPDQPTGADIKAAMDTIAPEVERCFDRYGVPGTAAVALEVDRDGEVAFAEVRGPFSDTPTGACITAAVKKARFPPFARAPMRIRYPFNLR